MSTFHIHPSASLILTVASGGEQEIIILIYRQENGFREGTWLAQSHSRREGERERKGPSWGLMTLVLTLSPAPTPFGFPVPGFREIPPHSWN